MSDLLDFFRQGSDLGATALCDTEQARSFGELWTRIERAIAGLQELPAGMLVIDAQPSIPTIEALLAALCAGRPVAMVNGEQAEALFPVEEQEPPLCTEIFPREVVWRLVRLHRYEELESTALLMLTSSSSGKLKAVRFSALGILANIEAVISCLSLQSVSQQHLALPLSYSFGLLGQLLPALAAGVQTRLWPSFAPLALATAEGRIGGMISGVPTQLGALAVLCDQKQVSCSDITHVVAAGAKLPLALRRQLRRVFPKAVISSNYGQTEMGPRILSFSSEHPEFFERGDGLPVRGIALKLAEDGELLVRGPQMMLGYLGELRRSEPEGWLATGDLAVQLDNGLVEITGRKDCLVKINGQRISLEAIEAEIRSLKGVEDAAVCPLALKNGLESMAAMVVLSKPAMEAGLDAAVLLQQLRSLSKIPILPQRIALVPALPLSENGKLHRPSVQAFFQQTGAD